jgi:hypothetical protein
LNLNELTRQYDWLSDSVGNCDTLADFIFTTKFGWMYDSFVTSDTRPVIGRAMEPSPNDALI